MTRDAIVDHFVEPPLIGFFAQASRIQPVLWLVGMLFLRGALLAPALCWDDEASR